jgi:hypothetical protein
MHQHLHELRTGVVECPTLSADSRCLAGCCVDADSNETGTEGAHDDALKLGSAMKQQDIGNDGAGIAHLELVEICLWC